MADLVRVPLRVEAACSLSVYAGFLWVAASFHRPKTRSYTGLTHDSKLLSGVNVDDCLTYFVSRGR